MALIPRKNLNLASTLLFLSAGLGVFTYLITPTRGTGQTVVVFITVGILFLVGLLVRAGFSWVRYVYAGLLVLGMIYAPFTIMRLLQFPFYLLIYLAQLFLQVAAAVYMFRKSEGPYRD